MFKKIYNYLFKACLHKWEIHKEGLILHKYGPKYGEPYGDWFILKCTKCGNLKQVKFT